MRIKSFKCTFIAVFVTGILFQLCLHANAEFNNWEGAVTMMKKGADQMVESRKIMQQKKDLGSVEKRIKDGHRMMMEAEKDRGTDTKGHNETGCKDDDGRPTSSESQKRCRRGGEVDATRSEDDLGSRKNDD